MKNFVTATLSLATAAAFVASGALAAQNDETTTDDGSTKADSPVVVERNDDGKATKVRIDGKVIEVCMTQEQDNCINPRAAGLDWGDRPLDYWPGKPASEM